MDAIEQVGCDFPVDFWIVKQEVAVMEVADVNHGWLLSWWVETKKPNHESHDRAKRKAEPLLTPLLLSVFFTVVGKSYLRFLL